MKKLILVVFFIPIISAALECSFFVGDHQYNATLSNDEIIIGDKSIQMLFERQKKLQWGVVENHYLSALATHLTERYIYLISTIDSDLAVMMEIFEGYALDLIWTHPQSDLIDESYRLHGYFRSEHGVTMVLCPSDDPGVMFSQIRASCTVRN